MTLNSTDYSTKQTDRRMNRNHLKFLRNTAIEEITGQRIREYESKARVPVSLPVPIEKIVEQVLGLCFDWDEIEEQPGETILGGLVVEQRKIMLNEKHRGCSRRSPAWNAARSDMRRAMGHRRGSSQGTPSDAARF